MASTMLARKSCHALTARVARPSRQSARAFVVRASTNEPEPSTSAPVEPNVTTFNSVPIPATVPVPTGPASVSFGEAMSFAGPGPETINGRLAMLGLFAAIGAELSTGESIFTQFENATPVVLATMALFSLASLVPILKGSSQEEAFGPFTPKAERLNGQAAMLGLAALILIELIKGSALF